MLFDERKSGGRLAHRTAPTACTTSRRRQAGDPPPRPPPHTHASATAARTCSHCDCVRATHAQAAVQAAAAASAASEALARGAGGGGKAHGGECGAGGGAGPRARDGDGGAGQRAGRAPEGCGLRSVIVRCRELVMATHGAHALAAKAAGARSFACAVHTGCGQDRRAHLRRRGSHLGRPVSRLAASRDLRLSARGIFRGARAQNSGPLWS